MQIYEGKWISWFEGTTVYVMLKRIVYKYPFHFQNNTDQRQFNDLKGCNEGPFSSLTKVLERWIYFQLVILFKLIDLDYTCSPIMTPFQILLTQLDVLKDLVLVVKLLQSIGWNLVPNQFASVVRFH